MKTKIQNYEMVAVFSPRISSEDKKSVMKKIESVIEGEGAKITKQEEWGNKDLVYPIMGNDKGNFWLFDLESEKGLKLKNINLFLNRESNIIRYLILKK